VENHCADQHKPQITSFQEGVLEPRLTWTSPDASWAGLDTGKPSRYDEASFDVRAGTQDHQSLRGESFSTAIRVAI
jgi:hypothetical protein